MAANEYVQAAAAQLQNGANALKSEADQIRADFTNFESQAHSEIRKKESEITEIHARLATDKPDGAEMALHGRESMIQKEIEGIKRDIESRRSQMNDAVRAKEGAMNDLMSQSRSLQSKAGSLR